MKKYNAAILGATGLVGGSMLEVLLQKKLPINKIYAIASASSRNKVLDIVVDGQSHQFQVEAIEDFNFNKVDFAISALDNSLAKIWLPKLASLGVISIDNSSAFRYDEDVPLVVPQINGDKIRDYKNKNIIANPNCSTIQMLLSLHPIYKLYDIKRIVASTYQSVSGAGSVALDNFENDFANRVIPKIDVFLEDNSTKEEWKMVVESKKILDNNLKIHANCARVPTLIGHCEYINVEFNENIDMQKITEALSLDANIELAQAHQYHNQSNCINVDKVFVSRLRRDSSVENGISYWCMANNIRIGASLNAVNILEELIAKYII